MRPRSLLQTSSGHCWASQQWHQCVWVAEQQEGEPHYAAEHPQTDPIWQVRFHSFEIYSTAKIEEKQNYMQMNPVRAGLVKMPTKWRWSSARWYIESRTVGIPIRWVD